MNRTASTLAHDLRPRRAAQRSFYVLAATVCCVVAFVGFAPTFWLPLAEGNFRQPFVVYLHGLLFFLWMLLFVGQAAFVASGRIARHETFGMAGIALAAGMLCVGVLMTIHSLHVGIAQGFSEQAREFAIVPLSAILLFAALVAVAIAKRRDSEAHKRLMLVATASLLQPGIGRWFALFLAPAGGHGPPPVAVTIVPGLLADLVIVAAMIYDRGRRGSIHPVYWVAGTGLLAVQLLRLPLSHTSAWMAVAGWLASSSI